MLDNGFNFTKVHFIMVSGGEKFKKPFKTRGYFLCPKCRLAQIDLCPSMSDVIKYAPGNYRLFSHLAMREFIIAADVLVLLS